MAGIAHRVTAADGWPRGLFQPFHTVAFWSPMKHRTGHNGSVVTCTDADAQTLEFRAWRVKGHVDFRGSSV